MAGPREEDHVILEDEDTLVILAPIHTDETIYCPVCNQNRQSKKKGKYKGDKSTDRFKRHLLDCHQKDDGTPQYTILYRCRACPFGIPENSPGSRKAMHDHYVGAHPGQRPLTPTRRVSIRQQLLPQPRDGQVGQRPRRASAPAACIRGRGPEGQRLPATVICANTCSRPPFSANEPLAPLNENMGQPLGAGTQSTGQGSPLPTLAGNRPETATAIAPTSPDACQHQLASLTSEITTPARTSSYSDDDVFESPTGREMVVSVPSWTHANFQVSQLTEDLTLAAYNTLEVREESLINNGSINISTTSSPLTSAPRPSTVGGARQATNSRGPRIPTTAQRQLISELEAVNSPQELEEMVARVGQFLNRFNSLLENGPGTNNNLGSRRGVHRSADRVAEATLLQKQYRANRKKTVQRIVNGPNKWCRVSKPQVEAYFSELAASRHGEEIWPNVLDLEPPSEESIKVLLEPFTLSEVQKKLRNRTNSAPGPDGLTYRNLRKADPKAQVITSLFNAIWRLEHFPHGWKDSITTLLHKKGDEQDLGNWRPIAMGDTCPKLFSAILADRVKQWAIANKRYSPSQKGFLKFEGCFEHNFVLQQAIDDAKRGKKEIVVVWIDFATAFTSVPHTSIFRALEGHGLPPKVLQVVKSMYQDSRTQVRTSDGLTNPIIMESGVKQGCPLSPDTFNLTLEVVLRSLSRTGIGYHLQEMLLNHVAYADDVALVADSADNMRELLRVLEESVRAVGLKIKPEKCASLHIIGGAESTVRPSDFTIQGEAIVALGQGEHYIHLGIPTGYQLKQTPDSTIQSMMDDTQKIDDSLLAPWQKLDALGTFILPRIDFLLQGANIEKSWLSMADDIIKSRTKDWMHLPRRASPELTFLPASRGGGGILPLSDLYDVAVLAHSYRMLYAVDDMVSTLAKNVLHATVSARLGRAATGFELAEYLSNTLELPPRYPMSSSWSRVRQASQRLSKKLPIKWVWSEEGGCLEFHCGGGPIATPNHRHLIYKQLRRRLNGFYEDQLRRKISQGKVIEVTSAAPVSNHFLRTGRNTRFCDWRFIHRARLNVLPLRGAMPFLPRTEQGCRKCGYQQETLPHVLNHCKVHSAVWQQRHNNIVERLRKAANCPGTFTLDKKVTGIVGPEARLRPDIVVRDDENKTVIIVDVAVPFENRIEAFRSKREEKLNKYAPLAQQLRQQGYRVNVAAFLVGSLGGWDKQNQRTLDLLQVNPRYAVMMRQFMVSDTIRHSRDIYVEHLKRPPETDPEDQLQLSVV